MPTRIVIHFKIYWAISVNYGVERSNNPNLSPRVLLFYYFVMYLPCTFTAMFLIASAWCTLFSCHFYHYFMSKALFCLDLFISSDQNLDSFEFLFLCFQQQRAIVKPSVGLYFWIFFKNFIIRLQRLNPCDEKTTKAKWRLKEVRNLYLYNIWSLLENSKHFRIKNSLQTILKFAPVFFFASFTHSSSVKMVQGQLWIAMLAVFFLRQRSLLFKKLLYLFKR